MPIELDDYVVLAHGVKPEHDSETVYGATRGVGVVCKAPPTGTQYWVKWRAGLLVGGHENWRFEKDLVKLTDEEKENHDKWIKGDDSIEPFVAEFFHSLRVV